MELVKSKIAMVTTEDSGESFSILLNTARGGGLFIPTKGYYYTKEYLKKECWKPQHLYFTIDETPKVGDWILTIDEIWQCSETDIGELVPLDRKIIATTNKKLKGLSQPFKLFIREYAEKGGVNEVYVEFNDIPYQPKVDSRFNTIFIHPIKKEFTHDDITHALAYGYKSRAEGLSHHQALLNYKKANKL